MQFITAVATVAAVAASLVSALPAPVAPRAVSRSFRLRSHFTEGDVQLGRQYLTTYHTGAGTNAPVFAKAMDDGDIFVLNNTQLQTQLGDYNYYLQLGAAEDLYAGWAPCTINIDEGLPDTPGFHINSTTGHPYLEAKSNEFAGWRICEWVHDVPELFYDTVEPTSGDVSSTCAQIRLIPEYI